MVLIPSEVNKNFTWYSDKPSNKGNIVDRVVISLLNIFYMHKLLSFMLSSGT